MEGHSPYIRFNNFENNKTKNVLISCFLDSLIFPQIIVFKKP